MFVVTQKLKLLKASLWDWNYNVFGDVYRNLEQAKRDVTIIQEEIATSDFSEDLFNKDISAHRTLDQKLSQHASFLCQKTRVKWLQQGDRNTSFFHPMAKLWQIKNQFPILKLGTLLQRTFILLEIIFSLIIRTSLLVLHMIYPI